MISKTQKLLAYMDGMLEEINILRDYLKQRAKNIEAYKKAILNDSPTR